MAIFPLPEVRWEGQKALARRRCATLSELLLVLGGYAIAQPYGFGRTERLRERDRRVDRLQAMLEGGRLRLKPPPPNWGDRHIDRRNRLTWAPRRACIATRLSQLAYQARRVSDPHEPLPLVAAYKPRRAAIEAIPDLRSLWRTKSIEDLEIASTRLKPSLCKHCKALTFERN